LHDRYPNFAALAEEKIAETDYRIRLIDRASDVVVLAPHGGRIEPGSSEVAAAIAGDKYSFYAFEGLRNGRDLHITSRRFDEPQGVALVKGATTVIAIHGRADADEPEDVWLGGRDGATSKAVLGALGQGGFSARVVTGKLAGTSADNICNRGLTGAGVQLELPRTLRDRLRQDESILSNFALAVQSALPRP
jgi:phage replication-related protein YjqB (UPF0714/DUF867 family)